MVSREALLQREEHRRAAHIAIVAQDFAGFRELERQHPFQRIHHVATAGVGEDLVRVARAQGVKLGNRLGREGGHRAVQLVF